METNTIKIAKERIQEGRDRDSLGRNLQELIRMEQELIEKMGREVKKELVSDEKRVEIIMLTVKNDRDFALRCLDGILNAQYPFKITVYENSDNSMNTSKIWNKLIKQSTCGYVLLIDSDALPMIGYKEDWLTPMVEALERHKDAAVIVPVAGVDSGVTTIQRVETHGDKEYPLDGHISGYCMLFRKSIFDELGYFDEDFMFYGQDSDWIERVLESGTHRVYMKPNVLVTHGMGNVSSISSSRMEQYGMFDRRLDSEYAKALYEQKKTERKERRGQ